MVLRVITDYINEAVQVITQNLFWSRNTKKNLSTSAHTTFPAFIRGGEGGGGAAGAGGGGAEEEGVVTCSFVLLSC